MKILISSHFYYPQVGGIEMVGRLLAEEFAAAGHEVKIVTQTPLPPGSGDDRLFPFEILRRPGPGALFAAVKWCDVFFHNNISLQTAWPLLAVRRPWAITHHTWIPSGWRSRNGLLGLLKRRVLRRAHSASISRAMAGQIGAPSTILSNPYQDDVFRRMPEIPRVRELIFVGRLVSQKGVDLLIEALGRLRQRGLEPELTLVGAGPEEAALREEARKRGVEGQIAFAGVYTGVDLARLLNAHRVMVVPSRWAEPFGIVALEGIACGCLVIGSEQGGLAEAIGPCGLTFPNGDGEALAARIETALADPRLAAALEEKAGAHLAPYGRKAAAAAYLRWMEGLVGTQ